MDPQRAFTKLTKRVPIEKTILSYRLAARELGISVKDAKQILAAYLDSDAAKDRGVTGVYLFSGYLKSDASGSGSKPNGKHDDNAMDIDATAWTQSSQNGLNDTQKEPEVVRTKTMMLVQQEELEVKTALFSPAPASHIYALAPARLTSLDLLTASSLSLIRPEIREQKWKAAPESAPAYGGIVHPDGERKVAQGKRKAPRMPPAAAAPKAGPSGLASKAKKDEKEDVKPSVAAKAKGKGKEKETAATKGTKSKKEEPKIRPIGQLGGLFAKKFDESASKKSKGKKKADSEDDETDEDEEEEDVKPKKVVPAKRKSTSPAVSRKKAAAAPPPAKAAPVKKDADIIMDDEEDWDMDEEAFLEAERAAEASAKARKEKAAANKAAASAASTSADTPKANETKAERQKRELEAMMKSDDMEVDEDNKTSRAQSPSRTPSSSSAAQSKSAYEKKKASTAPAQKSLGSFFKKG